MNLLQTSTISESACIINAECGSTNRTQIESSSTSIFLFFAWWLSSTPCFYRYLVFFSVIDSRFPIPGPLQLRWRSTVIGQVFSVFLGPSRWPLTSNLRILSSAARHQAENCLGEKYSSQMTLQLPLSSRLVLVLAYSPSSLSHRLFVYRRLLLSYLQFFSAQ